MTSVVEWYYVEIGTAVQSGPATAEELKAQFDGGFLDEECLAWHEDLDDWEMIQDIPELMEMLKGDVPDPSRDAAAIKAEAEKWKQFQTRDGKTYYCNADTDQTSWEKPDILKSDDEKERKGEWVWVPVESEEAFVQGKIVGSGYGGSTIVELKDGRQHTLPSGTDLIHVDADQLEQNVPDLVSLNDLNQPMIIFHLKKRFEKQEIYTSIAKILVSVNPYKELPLYTPAVMDEYIHRGAKDMPPHVFDIAGDCYMQLLDFGRNQSIIISGESGAGKTEATKQCLQYLAEIAGGGGNVEQKILLANPILEAFGNAKTTRNHNSSRFGKYCEIFFDRSARIHGARNTNYLLEKTRVVYHSHGERNYHIFYQLLGGCSLDQKRTFQLDSVLNFRYLNITGHDQYKIEGIDDALDFREVITAMTKLEFSEKDIGNLLQCISGILYLGNVTFRDKGDRASSIISKDPLGVAAELFQVESTILHEALCSRQFSVRGHETTMIGLSSEQAIENRDALAKFLYSKMFDWLVSRINQSLYPHDSSGSATEKDRSIGILDIFGFEIFENNSFEQLCINFTNEKLQQLFNRDTFKEEERIYKAEKIEFAHIDYIDNQMVLDLIEKSPKGVLKLLDEECRMPKGSDIKFVQKMHETHRTSKFYESVVKFPDSFIIHHYAGKVVYRASGFLDKNRDTLNQDLLGALKASKFEFFRTLFNSPQSRHTKDRKSSVGWQFAKQLSELVKTLNQTEAHYIRTIKPNDAQKSDYFVGPLVLEQLRYCGVFEAIEIRKLGYPFKLSHEEFYKRYICVFPKVVSTDVRTSCQLLADALARGEVKIGQTMVLYRTDEYKSMETQRNESIKKNVISIQAFVRGWRARKQTNLMKIVKPMILKATETRDLELLEDALYKAKPIEFPMKEIGQAGQLREELRKEKHVNEMLKPLLNIDPEVAFEDLCKAIAAADEINLQSGFVDRAREAISRVVQRRKCKSILIRSISSGDPERIRSAVSEANSFNIIESAELQQASQILSSIDAENTSIDSLEKEMQVGGWFPNQQGSVNYTRLQHALEEARNLNITTPYGKKSLKLAEFLVRLRQAMMGAEGTLEPRNWKVVEDVLHTACNYSEDFKDQPEISAARTALKSLQNDFTAVEEVAIKLEKAVEVLDQSMLELGLEHATNLGLGDEEYPIVPTARAYLERIIETRKYTKEAMEQKTEDLLVFACQCAETLNYRTIEIGECIELRDKVVNFQSDMDQATKALHPLKMREVLETADLLGKQDTPQLEHIRTLLFDTPPDKFITMQLRAAVAMNDPSRVTKVTIQLKDLFFEKSGKLFHFRNYPKLVQPKSWADAKFGILKKQKKRLAETFYTHTKKPIHTALTDLPSNYNKHAVRTFRSILGYMGDIHYNQPTMLAREVVNMGLKHPTMRDEIFCQIVKQLNSNPRSESEKRGWQLMMLCLDTFPPGSDLENYLEMWLRMNPPPAQHYQFYVVLLHQAMHSGASNSLPTNEDLKSVLQGKPTRRFSRSAMIDEEEKQALAQARTPFGIHKSNTSLTKLAPTVTPTMTASQTLRYPPNRTDPKQLTRHPTSLVNGKNAPPQPQPQTTPQFQPFVAHSKPLRAKMSQTLPPPVPTHRLSHYSAPAYATTGYPSNSHERQLRAEHASTVDNNEASSSSDTFKINDSWKWGSSGISALPTRAKFVASAPANSATPSPTAVGHSYTTHPQHQVSHTSHVPLRARLANPTKQTSPTTTIVKMPPHANVGKSQMAYKTSFKSNPASWNPSQQQSGIWPARVSVFPGVPTRAQFVAAPPGTAPSRYNPAPTPIQVNAQTTHMRNANYPMRTSTRDYSSRHQPRAPSGHTFESQDPNKPIQQGPGGSPTEVKNPKPLWRAALDPTSGHTYYYHTKTKQVTWEKPSDFEG